MKISVVVAVLGAGAAGACVDDGPVSDLATAEGVLLNPEVDQFVPAAAQAAIALMDGTGAPLAPAHAHLMKDGRVLLIGVSGNAGLLTPPALTAPVPTSIQLAAATAAVELPYPGLSMPPYQVWDSLFCGGHTQTADGAFLSMGGTRYLFNTATSEFAVFGTAYPTRFDGTWTRPAGRMVVPGPQGDPGRWYGQATRMGDGKILVTGGWDLPMYGVNNQIAGAGTANVSAELYDPTTDTFTAVTDTTQTPLAIWNPDYTHVHVLPYPGDYDAIVFGEAGTPVVFGDFPGRWFVQQTRPRPGNTVRPDGTSPQSPNSGASTVTLPMRATNGQWGYLNGAILVAGGNHVTANEHSIDVYDPVANLWLPRRNMETRRHHPSTVLLPDSRVLVVAGHNDPAPTDTRVRRAIYVDPAAGFALTEGSSLMGETRGYHTVTLLLPDGRVLIAGGRNGGPDSIADEKPTLRYLYPGYMFRARPTITTAVTTLRLGQATALAVTGAPTEAVLIGLGSMTHSFDANQRAIQLALATTGTNQVTVIGPPDPETAPPGYYMLFVLDAQRTPSLARIVRVY